MAPRLRSIAALLLALVLTIAYLQPAPRTSVEAGSSIPNLDDPQIDFVPDEQQKQNYWAQGGNDIVHEVWSVLRDFEPTWKDSVLPAPSTGLLETIWHYTKVVFRALFMNAPTHHDGTDDEKDTPSITGDLKKGVDTLKTAAVFDDPDAMFLLAEMNFYGNFSYPRNFTEAMARYQQLADLDGNNTAQYMLGLMYATGIGGLERNQAKALLYHTFAAEQDNIQSEMTLAFRYHSGIGCPRDCNKAVDYYKRVADKAMNYWLSGPPGGHSFVRNAYRWVEVDGGIYGEGASVSSSGPNAARDSFSAAHVDYVLEYLDMRERQGDYTAMLTLGKHYYEAPRGYKRNLRKAQRQFMKIARAYWGKDGKVNPKAPKGIERVAGKAAAYIGRMFLRGEGMEQNFEKAQTWFKRGVANGDSFAQYHLGLMYRDGLGVPQDGVRAGTYLKAAAEQSLPIAQSALGVLFLDQGDVDTAGRYFELAAGAGVMEAFYYLAELTNQGVGRERNCGLATVYYKVVAERAEILHSPFIEANAAYERGDFERAFVAALKTAEHGYENAQANVAYLLDQKTSVISLPGIPLLSATKPGSTRRSKLLNDPELALAYFTRSAKQANVDSLIKMGDYYLSLASSSAAQQQAKGLTTLFLHTRKTSPKSSGSGNSSSTEVEAQAHSNLEKATTCYTTAAESHHSAQALWNLGWMHENGIGSVAQDFHMAKRYYDLALEMNSEAYLPVTLALTKLRLRSWWNGVSGGKINPIRDDDDDDDEGGSAASRKRPKTWSEWLNRFLDAAEEMDAQEAAAAAAARDRDDDDFLGYAAAEPGMPGGDADFAAAQPGGGDGDGARERHTAAGAGQTGAQEQNQYGENNGYGADEWDEFDDGLVESLIIIALAGALALLIYARQARQRGLEQDRRQQQQQNQNPAPRQGQNGAGLFPPPGDPEFNNWVVGGIGH
ncbi:hypothetical protein A1O1_07164 [Capronia coronata CBS 617.96]|uniref:SEL1 protein n=1 Tax=Capronia coronata CBS 617.96 TaxID=1182541 RepID=W9Y2T2_9EURO|nr:uncharacterized protein A1O1_07164 [Capronia coronata CBS 617.96]EXJ83541.1 hypothetical protein A1O1_07164 [Capronia coronata CBS 617.96]